MNASTKNGASGNDATTYAAAWNAYNGASDTRNDATNYNWGNDAPKSTRGPGGKIMDPSKIDCKEIGFT